MVQREPEVIVDTIENYDFRTAFKDTSVIITVTPVGGVIYYELGH